MTKENVKKASCVRDLNELELHEETVEVLKKYTVDSLILAARREVLFGELMKARGKYLYSGASPRVLAAEAVLCDRVVNDFCRELDKRGFFRDDFKEYTLSFNILAFMRAAINQERNETYFNERYNVRREYKSFDNDEYETFSGLSPEQIQTFMLVIRTALDEIPYEIICFRMGLYDGVCIDRKSVADAYNLSEREVEGVEKRVFEKIGRIINKEILKKVYKNFDNKTKRGLISVKP